MSDGLIKRSDAIKAVSKVDDYGDGIGFEVRSHCLVELELVPSADRPQGEWKPFDLTWGRSIYACSACGESVEVPTCMNKPLFKFCPLCGAQMKGVGDERVR